MRCPRCNTDNPDENRFCTDCGARLPEGAGPEGEQHVPDAVRAQQLIDLAFQYSDQGLLAEAIQAAEQAVAISPSSTSVHSLLGILYERAGQRQKAIAEYERALSLSPRSVADQQALQQLLQTVPPPRRRVPAAAPRTAIMGGFVLLSLVLLGLIWVMLRPMARQTEPTGGQPTERVAPVLAQTSPIPSPSAAAIPARPVAPPPPTPAPVGAPVLPYMSRGVPVTLPRERAQTAPQPTPTSLRAPLVSAPGPVPAPALALSPPRRLEPPLPMPQGPIVATTELARTYYFLGDYDKAIRTYAKYVQTRPDAAPQIREELAFCYYRTNLRGEAQAEYERALTGYEAQIASGQNVDDASHGARTCMAALRALEAR